MTHLLLTGSTGLLGSYLLRDLLLAGEQVVTVVRHQHKQQVDSRIESVLQPLEGMLGRALPRPIVFAGDLASPWLGLDSEQIRWLESNCDRLLHSAASLAFKESGGEPHLSNVEGVKNVLALCARARIGSLYHVSTAYVCGLRRGSILETELDEGQEFANVYESTKATAEQLIRQARAPESYTIFRPSIIVGDSRTGYTSTFHGLYTPLRVIQALRNMTTVKQMLEVDYLSALGMTGEERKNIVPVDWISEAIVKIMQRETQQGQVYALTSRNPVYARDILATFEAVATDYLKDQTPSPADPWGNGASTNGKPAEPSKYVDSFVQQFSVYESYWRDDPDFDSTHTQSILPELPCPDVDQTSLSRLSKYALDANFGFPQARLEQPRFELASWLRQGLSCSLEQPLSNPLFSLICTGPGGGTWTIDAPSGAPWRAVPGTNGRLPWIRTRASVMRALATGETTSTSAAQRGQVVTCFEPQDHQQFSKLIRILDQHV